LGIVTLVATTLALAGACSAPSDSGDDAGASGEAGADGEGGSGGSGGGAQGGAAGSANGGATPTGGATATGGTAGDGASGEGASGESGAGGEGGGTAGSAGIGGAGGRPGGAAGMGGQVGGAGAGGRPGGSGGLGGGTGGNGGGAVGVPCGVDTCDTPTEHCAIRPNTNPECTATPCVGGCVVLNCDGPEDCTQGQVCQYSLGESEYFLCGPPVAGDHGIPCSSEADCSPTYPVCRNFQATFAAQVGWQPRYCSN
jgi:hypothetical protein